MNTGSEFRAAQRKRCIDIEEVSGKTTWSKAAIYALGDEKSEMYDPTWPSPVQLGRRKSVWIESEIDAWIESKVAASRDTERHRVNGPSADGSTK